MRPLRRMGAGRAGISPVGSRAELADCCIAARKDRFGARPLEEEEEGAAPASTTGGTLSRTRAVPPPGPSSTWMVTRIAALSDKGIRSKDITSRACMTGRVDLPLLGGRGIPPRTRPLLAMEPVIVQQVILRGEGYVVVLRCAVPREISSRLSRVPCSSPAPPTRSTPLPPPRL